MRGACNDVSRLVPVRVISQPVPGKSETGGGGGDFPLALPTFNTVRIDREVSTTIRVTGSQDKLGLVGKSRQDWRAGVEGGARIEKLACAPPQFGAAQGAIRDDGNKAAGVLELR
jgi:hypothetical protein